MGKIERMPSSTLSVQTLMHMALDDTDIQGVVLVAKDANGHMWSAWSSMSIADLSMAALHLNKEVMDVIE